MAKCFIFLRYTTETLSHGHNFNVKALVHAFLYTLMAYYAIIERKRREMRKIFDENVNSKIEMRKKNTVNYRHFGHKINVVVNSSVEFKIIHKIF